MLNETCEIEKINQDTSDHSLILLKAQKRSYLEKSKTNLRRFEVEALEKIQVSIIRIIAELKLPLNWYRAPL